VQFYLIDLLRALLSLGSQRVRHLPVPGQATGRSAAQAGARTAAVAVPAGRPRAIEMQRSRGKDE
jgi:hypothetical protein